MPTTPSRPARSPAWDTPRGRKCAQAETRYETELFEVEPGEDALRSLDGDASVRWLDESEVRLGRCRDGRPVSPTVAFLLDRAGLS